MLLGDFSLIVIVLGLLIATAVAAWMVGRRQVDAQPAALREELRITNRDLQQALTEAANLKSENAALRAQIAREGQHSSEFLDNLGHKLRTPLNSISGYSELLQSGLYGELNEKQLDRLSIIRRNGDNLLDVISNMLDLNKINAGRLELDWRDFSLNATIEQMLPALQSRYPKALKLETALDDDLRRVRGDEARVCQAMTMLIDNALRFTFEGGVTIRTRMIGVKNGTSPEFALPFRGWLSDGAWVVVEVSDTGIGIAPEDQARVFDEFFQVADPRLEGYFGTGLGLTIAKRLIDMHGGAIWLKSTPGSGSTFYAALRG